VANPWINRNARQEVLIQHTAILYRAGRAAKQMFSSYFKRRQATTLSVLRNSLSSITPRRTVQDNLQMLRLLNLVDSSGKGVGARWKLKGVPL
jgi:hypothetical protein